MTLAKTNNPRFSDVYRHAPLEFRFHESYTVNPGNGCWEWHGFIQKALGYGIICDNHKRLLAHRVSYELHKGPPHNSCVLHRCDNRKCVNPDHLFLGTRRDNNLDCQQKRRHQHGERHYCAKLKETDIPVIIERFETGSSVQELAGQYGLSQGAIHQVVHKQTWKHLHKG